MKVTGPCLSLSAGPPLRKKRTPWGQTIHTPPVEHVLVTAGDPAPDPDCTGTYNYAGTHNDEHYYQLIADLTWFIWYDTDNICWVISDELGTYGTNGWWRDPPLPGSYTNPTGTNTGIPIASEPIL